MESRIERIASSCLHLVIEYNPHQMHYEYAEEYIRNRLDQVGSTPEAEITPEDMAAIIATNTMWRVTWYPDKPTINYDIFAPTIARALEQVEAHIAADQSHP